MDHTVRESIGNSRFGHYKLNGANRHVQNILANSRIHILLKHVEHFQDRIYVMPQNKSKTIQKY